MIGLQSFLGIGIVMSIRAFPGYDSPFRKLAETNSEIHIWLFECILGVIALAWFIVTAFTFYFPLGAHDATRTHRIVVNKINQKFLKYFGYGSNFKFAFTHRISVLL